MQFYPKDKNESSRLRIWGVCQWPEWFTGNWNWRNFTFIRVEVEQQPHKGGSYEFQLGFLGFVGGIDYWSKKAWADFHRQLTPKEEASLDEEINPTDVKVV